MKKYKDKYRIASARAQWWDYGANGLYFVTICCHNRVCWFGDVVDGEMILSKIGEIAESEWLKTFDMRPDMNLWMGEYVVMPNHFHAIIGIGDNRYNTQRRDAMHCVSTSMNVDETTDNGETTTNNKNDTNNIQSSQPKNKFGPQSKNLASIIRGFKIGVTKNARQINPVFKWQARYHDHIIRDEKSYCNISNYIENNPKKWDTDKFHMLGQQNKHKIN